ncbi:MAG: T9SS type A sorting domain-containing protein [Crocinitomicaceae bacterium]|nr:T9SS type A sorting domain-containing protein [Crocinitomicaceae bacterium]
MELNEHLGGGGATASGVGTAAHPSFSNSTDEFIFSSVRLAADAKINDTTSAFIQMQSVRNWGNTTNTNAANVTGAGAGTATSTAMDLAPLATMFVETASMVTPSAIGTYNVVYSASGDSADVDLLNNTIAGTFDVSQYQYGKDDGAMTGSYGPFDDDSDGINDPYEILAEYEINANTSFTGVQVCLSTSSTDGAEIYYNLYYDDGAGGWIPEYDGLGAPVPTYTVSAAQFTASGGAEWIDLAFPSAISVDAAVAPAVYPVVGYSFDPVNYCVSGSAPDTSNYLTVFATTAGQSDYFITSKPMLRLSQDPNLGGGVDIDELNASVELGQNVPNPTNGSTIIPFNLATTANVEFIVTDVMGKIVESRDLGTISSGTHSVNMSTIDLAGGIYYYTLIADGKKSTKKMSVAK